MKGLELAEKIKILIDDKKGEETVCFFIGEKSTVTDYLIIAAGNVDTHVRAIACNIIVELKKKGIAPIYKEGEENGVWICLDYGDVIVHIMRKRERDFYNLESIWGGCPAV